MAYNKLLKEGDWRGIVELLSARDPDTFSVEGNDRNIVGLTDKDFFSLYQYQDVALRKDVKNIGITYVCNGYSVQVYEDNSVLIYNTENGMVRKPVSVKLIYLFEEGILYTQQIIVEVGK